MEVKNVKIDMYGDYRLVMSNNYGNNTVIYYLKPKGKRSLNISSNLYMYNIFFLEKNHSFNPRIHSKLVLLL